MHKPTPADVCPVIGCGALKAPAFCLCPRHWRRIPSALQKDIIAAFRPGQEIDGRLSRGYQKLIDSAIYAAGGGLAF